MGLPDVGNVVEVSHKTVPVIRTSKPPCLSDLWAEVAQYDHCGRVWPDQNRPYKELELVHGRISAVKMTVSAVNRQ